VVVIDPRLRVKALAAKSVGSYGPDPRLRVKALAAKSVGSYGPGRHGFTDTNRLFAP
jgi:hypothetical protein